MKENRDPKDLSRKLHDIEAIFTDKSENEIKSDVLGSYTGTGEADLIPEQDVDDL